MSKFIFPKSLQEFLDESGSWPSHKPLRAFSKARGGHGFKTVNYSAIRRGEAQSHPELLELILLYLKEYDQEFASRFLPKGGSDDDEKTLSSRYIEAVPDDFVPETAPENVDIVRHGPAGVVSDLLQSLNVEIADFRLRESDIPKARALWARSVYRDLTNEYSSDPSTTLDVALEEFEFSSCEQFDALMLRYIRHSPNSVLFHEMGESSGFLSMVLQASDIGYEQFKVGDIDEYELASGKAPPRTRNLFLAGAFEDYHGISGKQKRKLQLRLMASMLTQIATLSLPVLKHGVRFITYTGPPKIEAWAKRWRFKRLPGKRMKRTEFQLHEQVFNSTPPLNPFSVIIWCLVVIFQAVASITTRSSEKAEPSSLLPSGIESDPPV